MKPKQKRRSKRRNIPHLWLSIILVGLIIAWSIIANQFQLPARFLIPALVIGILMLASLLLWQYGNYNAPHHQMWWEDKVPDDATHS
jgi:hypothetical protein